MLRFTSWITDPRGFDRLGNGSTDGKMADATCHVVEMQTVGAATKRKWGGSDDATDVADSSLQDGKRRKDMDFLDDSDSPPDTGIDIDVGVVDRTAGPTGNQNIISNAIEAQFSLEILLKHNELRLINQELAKCQVALEQLRRCHLIPFPTSQPSAESRIHVTNGTGPAVGPENVPRWAPPFGVTDGPYTRHYAKWLIPDPNFDGVDVECPNSAESRAGKTVPEGRATRNSYADGTLPASKSRSHRGSAGQKLQALSSGYPQVKEKAGPCVLKRGDGQTVKLVCIDCRRENFSSTQGFINHCRIAHRRDFKSHEEAAVASGQPIEIDEVGAIVGEEKTAPVPNGLVHPLIRNAPTGTEAKEAYKAILSHLEQSKTMFHEGRLPGVTSIPTSAKTTPCRSKTSFVPSSSTPHLSDLMRRRGFSGNLDEIVLESRRHIDFDDDSLDDDSEDTEGMDKKPHSISEHHPTGLDGTHSPLPVMRMPSNLSGRPGSAKGIESRSRQVGLSGISPRVSQTTPAIHTVAPLNHRHPLTRLDHDDTRHDHRDVDAEMAILGGSSIVDLSPNTVASNNAPSLVSDDGEYDEDNVDSGSSEDEAEESDVAEIDIEEDLVPSTVLRNRTGGGGEGMRLRKEEKEKHVTFVSPVKEAGKDRKHSRRS